MSSDSYKIRTSKGTEIYTTSGITLTAASASISQLQVTGPSTIPTASYAITASYALNASTSTTDTTTIEAQFWFLI